MAKVRGRRASRTGRSVAKKRRDWVYTFESYDDNATTTVELTANTEAWLPLANTWSNYLFIEGAEDTGRTGFGMPWPRRTAIRAVGWIHCWGRAPMSSDEHKIQCQIERIRVDDETGVPQPPPTDIFDPSAYDRRVYWRRQFWPTSSTTWLSGDWPPRPLNIVIPVNARFRMPLDESEIPALVIAIRTFTPGAALPLQVRPQIRTLIEF